MAEKLTLLDVDSPYDWEPTSTGVRTIQQWKGTDAEFSVKVQPAPFEYKWKTTDLTRVNMLRPSDGPFNVAITHGLIELFKEYPDDVGKYWKIRERLGTLYFETSTDGSNWITVAHYVHNLELTYIQVYINNQESGEFGSINTGFGALGFGRGGWGG